MSKKLTSFFYPAPFRMLHPFAARLTKSIFGEGFNALLQKCGINILLIIFVGSFLLFSGKIAEKGKVNAKLMVSDEILVKYKENKETEIIKLKPGEDFYKALDDLKNNLKVEYAEPNYLYRATMIPSDTYYGNQWYLEKIKAPEAWNEQREADNIVIAVLDSGVQIEHPDLRGNIWRNNKEIPENNIDDDKNGFNDDIYGWDFVNNEADPEPKFKGDFTETGILHGTVVAGIAAASGNNAAGITGVAWKAKIMSLKVLDDAGEGNTGNVIKAVDYAVKNGADIINLSFVGFGYSLSLDNAIKRAYDAGIIVVAAAGNEQGQGDGYFLDDTPMYPVCHDGGSENRVIGVAAVDTLDQKAAFSSFGFKCVDISAPGISIFSTMFYSPSQEISGKLLNKYYDGYWSGTSMATPMISAAAALIAKSNPGLSRAQVIKILLDSADNINRLNPNYLNQLGKGRLNLYAAMAKAKEELNNKTTNILTAPQSNYKSNIKITDKDGKLIGEFNPYSENFLGGANIASGDVDGDGNSEIITGPGAGGGPHIRIFDSSGKLKNQFFAYSLKFRGGVKVAVCDVNNDEISEIVTGPGAGGGSHIRIFDSSGKLKNQFFAFNSNFKGGVNIACGDVNGDNQNEIVVGAGEGGGPQIRIFKPNGSVLWQFFAFDSRFRGGVNVAVGNISGGIRGKKLEIIAAPGRGGGPQIRIFDNYKNVISQFFAYNENFRGGVNLAAGDVDNDGLAEIITGAGPGGAPYIRVFKADKTFIGSFYAYDQLFTGGANIGVLRTNRY